MDNIAHTLAGLALAEAGLKRRTALGTATLAIAANLPDVDALIYFIGDGADALAFRRGWTHGPIAMLLLPLALAAGGIAHRVAVELTFEDSLKGLTTKIPVELETACSVCGGTGAEPGTAPRVCPDCQGSGVISGGIRFWGERLSADAGLAAYADLQLVTDQVDLDVALGVDAGHLSLDDEVAVFSVLLDP